MRLKRTALHIIIPSVLQVLDRVSGDSLVY